MCVYWWIGAYYHTVLSNLAKPVDPLNSSQDDISTKQYHWLSIIDWLSPDNFEKTMKWGNMAWNQYTDSEVGKGVWFVHIKEETEQETYNSKTIIPYYHISSQMYDEYEYEIIWELWWAIYNYKEYSLA